jgi:hypothetical protein
MTEPTQDGAVVEQTVTPTEPGPVDPNIVTVLEGSDDSVAPDEQQIAFGAAGDVPGLVSTPAGLANDPVVTATTTDQVGQTVASGNADAQANPGVTHEVELQDTVGQQDRT